MSALRERIGKIVEQLEEIEKEHGSYCLQEAIQDYENRFA